MQNDTSYIYGRHVVEEALISAPDIVQHVYLAHSVHDQGLKNLIRRAGAHVSAFDESKPPKGFDVEAAHQGVVALVELGGLLRDYKSFVEGLDINSDTSIAILGEVQDPQNVGAIIRSAAAFGVSGVLIPEHNQAQVTGSVIKVSAGMAFKMPLVTVGNVNQVVRDLKERGFWIYGLAGDAQKKLHQEKFDAPAVFVLGSESRGIREKTRELCDVLLSIPSDAQCESLNVAASGAVALYEWSKQHPLALQ